MLGFFFFFFLRCMCKYEGWRSGELSAFLNHVQLQELNTDLFFNRHNKANTIFSRDELSSCAKELSVQNACISIWEEGGLTAYFFKPLLQNTLEPKHYQISLFSQKYEIDQSNTDYTAEVRCVLGLHLQGNFDFMKQISWKGSADVKASLHELLRLWDTSPARSKRLDLGTRIPVTQLSPGSGALSSLHLLLWLRGKQNKNKFSWIHFFVCVKCISVMGKLWIYAKDQNIF